MPRTKALPFSLLALLLCAMPALAADVTFNLVNWTGGAGTNAITLTPTLQPGVSPSAWVLGPSLSAVPAGGQATFSGLAAGAYRVTFAGIPRTATILVPDSSDTVDSLSIITSGTNAPADGLVAWSAAVSDARYVRGIAAGTNVTASTNGGVVTLSAAPGSGTSGVEVPHPEGGTLPFTVYQLPGSIYRSSLDIEDFDVARTATYYVATNGSDSADGLTWATAKLTVTNAATTAGSNTRKIVIGPGTYAPGLSLTHATSLVTTGGVVSLGPVTNTGAGLFLRGVNFTSGLYWNSASGSNVLAAVDCAFDNSVRNGLHVMANDGFIYALRCSASSNTYDGFNYHKLSGGDSTLLVLEEDCAARFNGAAIADNSTTVHDGISIVRLNGVYFGSYGRNVHDIQGGLSWNCNVMSGGGRLAGQDYAFSRDETTRMYLYDCASLGASPLFEPVYWPVVLRPRTLGLGANPILSGTMTVLGQLNANAASISLVAGTNFRNGNHANFTIGSSTTTNIAVAATNVNFSANVAVAGTISGSVGAMGVDSGALVVNTSSGLKSVPDWTARQDFDPGLAGGSIYATNYVGNGGNITNLNADRLASGTVPDDRMPRVFGGITNALTHSNTGTNVLVSDTRTTFRNGGNSTLIIATNAIGIGQEPANGFVLAATGSGTFSGIVAAGTRVQAGSDVRTGNGGSFYWNSTGSPEIRATNYMLGVFGTNTSFTGTSNLHHVQVSGGVTASNFVGSAGYFISSNALTAWPTAPATPGAAYFGNSNGVVYLLTSGLGSTWTATNKIAP